MLSLLMNNNVVAIPQIRRSRVLTDENKLDKERVEERLGGSGQRLTVAGSVCSSLCSFEAMIIITVVSVVVLIMIPVIAITMVPVIGTLSAGHTSTKFLFDGIMLDVKRLLVDSPPPGDQVGGHHVHQPEERNSPAGLHFHPAAKDDGGDLEEDVDEAEEACQYFRSL